MSTQNNFNRIVYPLTWAEASQIMVSPNQKISDLINEKEYVTALRSLTRYDEKSGVVTLKNNNQIDKYGNDGIVIEWGDNSAIKKQTDPRFLSKSKFFNAVLNPSDEVIANNELLNQRKQNFQNYFASQNNSLDFYEDLKNSYGLQNFHQYTEQKLLERFIKDNPELNSMGFKVDGKNKQGLSIYRGTGEHTAWRIFLNAPDARDKLPSSFNIGGIVAAQFQGADSVPIYKEKVASLLDKDFKSDVWDVQYGKAKNSNPVVKSPEQLAKEAADRESALELERQRQDKLAEQFRQDQVIAENLKRDSLLLVQYTELQTMRAQKAGLAPTISNYENKKGLQGQFLTVPDMGHLKSLWRNPANNYKSDGTERDKNENFKELQRIEGFIADNNQRGLDSVYGAGNFQKWASDNRDLFVKNGIALNEHGYPSLTDVIDGYSRSIWVGRYYESRADARGRGELTRYDSEGKQLDREKEQVVETNTISLISKLQDNGTFQPASIQKIYHLVDRVNNTASDEKQNFYRGEVGGAGIVIGQNIPKSIGNVDRVIVGEGEATMLDLYNSLTTQEREKTLVIAAINAGNVSECIKSIDDFRKKSGKSIAIHVAMDNDRNEFEKLKDANGKQIVNYNKIVPKKSNAGFESLYKSVKEVPDVRGICINFKELTVLCDSMYNDAVQNAQAIGNQVEVQSLNELNNKIQTNLMVGSDFNDARMILETAYTGYLKQDPLTARLQSQAYIRDLIVDRFDSLSEYQTTTVFNHYQKKEAALQEKNSIQQINAASQAAATATNQVTQPASTNEGQVYDSQGNKALAFQPATEGVPLIQATDNTQAVKYYGNVYMEVDKIQYDDMGNAYMVGVDITSSSTELEHGEITGRKQHDLIKARIMTVDERASIISQVNHVAYEQAKVEAQVEYDREIEKFNEAILHKQKGVDFVLNVSSPQVISSTTHAVNGVNTKYANANKYNENIVAARTISLMGLSNENDLREAQVAIDRVAFDYIPAQGSASGAIIYANRVEKLSNHKDIEFADEAIAYMQPIDPIGNEQNPFLEIKVERSSFIPATIASLNGNQQEAPDPVPTTVNGSVRLFLDKETRFSAPNELGVRTPYNTNIDFEQTVKRYMEGNDESTRHYVEVRFNNIDMRPNAAEINIAKSNADSVIGSAYKRAKEAEAIRAFLVNSGIAEQYGFDGFQDHSVLSQKIASHPAFEQTPENVLEVINLQREYDETQRLVANSEKVLLGKRMFLANDLQDKVVHLIRQPNKADPLNKLANKVKSTNKEAYSRYFPVGIVEKITDESKLLTGLTTSAITSLGNISYTDVEKTPNTFTINDDTSHIKSRMVAGLGSVTVGQSLLENNKVMNASMLNHALKSIDTSSIIKFKNTQDVVTIPYEQNAIANMIAKSKVINDDNPSAKTLQKYRSDIISIAMQDKGFRDNVLKPIVEQLDQRKAQATQLNDLRNDPKVLAMQLQNIMCIYDAEGINKINKDSLMPNGVLSSSDSNKLYEDIISSARTNAMRYLDANALNDIFKFGMSKERCDEHNKKSLNRLELVDRVDSRRAYYMKGDLLSESLERVKKVSSERLKQVVNQSSNNKTNTNMLYIVPDSQKAAELQSFINSDDYKQMGFEASAAKVLTLGEMSDKNARSYLSEIKGVYPHANIAFVDMPDISENVIPYSMAISTSYSAEMPHVYPNVSFDSLKNEDNRADLFAQSLMANENMYSKIVQNKRLDALNQSGQNDEDLQVPVELKGIYKNAENIDELIDIREKYIESVEDAATLVQILKVSNPSLTNPTNPAAIRQATDNILLGNFTTNDDTNKLANEALASMMKKESFKNFSSIVANGLIHNELPVGYALRSVIDENLIGTNSVRSDDAYEKLAMATLASTMSVEQCEKLMSYASANKENKPDYYHYAAGILAQKQSMPRVNGEDEPTIREDILYAFDRNNAITPRFSMEQLNNSNDDVLDLDYILFVESSNDPAVDDASIVQKLLENNTEINTNIRVFTINTSDKDSIKQAVDTIEKAKTNNSHYEIAYLGGKGDEFSRIFNQMDLQVVTIDINHVIGDGELDHHVKDLRDVNNPILSVKNTQEENSANEIHLEALEKARLKDLEQESLLTNETEQVNSDITNAQSADSESNDYDNTQTPDVDLSTGQHLSAIIDFNMPTDKLQGRLKQIETSLLDNTLNQEIAASVVLKGLAVADEKERDMMMSIIDGIDRYEGKVAVSRTSFKDRVRFDQALTDDVFERIDNNMLLSSNATKANPNAQNNELVKQTAFKVLSHQYLGMEAVANNPEQEPRYAKYGIDVLGDKLLNGKKYELLTQIKSTITDSLIDLQKTYADIATNPNDKLVQSPVKQPEWLAIAKEGMETMPADPKPVVAKKQENDTQLDTNIFNKGELDYVQAMIKGDKVTADKIINEHFDGQKPDFDGLSAKVINVALSEKTFNSYFVDSLQSLSTNKDVKEMASLAKNIATANFDSNLMPSDWLRTKELATQITIGTVLGDNNVVNSENVSDIDLNDIGLKLESVKMVGKNTTRWLLSKDNKQSLTANIDKAVDKYAILDEKTTLSSDTPKFVADVTSTLKAQQPKADEKEVKRTHQHSIDRYTEKGIMRKVGDDDEVTKARILLASMAVSKDDDAQTIKQKESMKNLTTVVLQFNGSSKAKELLNNINSMKLDDNTVGWDLKQKEISSNKSLEPAMAMLKSILTDNKDTVFNHKTQQHVSADVVFDDVAKYAQRYGNVDQAIIDKFKEVKPVKASENSISMGAVVEAVKILDEVKQHGHYKIHKQRDKAITSVYKHVDDKLEWNNSNKLDRGIKLFANGGEIDHKLITEAIKVTAENDPMFKAVARDLLTFNKNDDNNKFRDILKDIKPKAEKPVHSQECLDKAKALATLAVASVVMENNPKFLNNRQNIIAAVDTLDRLSPDSRKGTISDFRASAETLVNNLSASGADTTWVKNFNETAVKDQTHDQTVELDDKQKLDTEIKRVEPDSLKM